MRVYKGHKKGPRPSTMGYKGHKKGPKISMTVCKGHRKCPYNGCLLKKHLMQTSNKKFVFYKIQTF